MSLPFEKTQTWKRTLGSARRRNGDMDAGEQEGLARLRVAYLRMRENTAFLVSQIAADCKGLTVHDVSHLDALWDIADLVAGPNYNLTPAEGFVLGGAILLHDAGMAVAAFPGGLAQLKNTTEWRDNVYALSRRERIAGELDTLSSGHLPNKIEKEALFATLRDLHASVAERLATQSWPGPGGGTVFLLEDPGLRKAYGPLIGAIAHSHHWDIDRIGSEFGPIFPPAVGLPAEWNVNGIKVAGLLRCIDAAHIDERRAPTFLYALSRPQGVSEEHWSFQNKLNQAGKQDGRIIFTSGPPFSKDEVAAWWRAYDTARMIEGELQQTNALFAERQVQALAMSGVQGADNPRLFARYVKTAGWEPVNAEVRVTDPVGLARTLGGRSLYGGTAFPVLRELIQNAADAVRARRKLENRELTWGRIKLTVETAEADAKDHSVWLHIDDNGIGMSQIVLTTTLIDFGKSIWNSAQLRQEYPGLASVGISPVGKFGIGFFSVFMLAERVLVASKRYDEAETAISVLEFSSLNARPILMKGTRANLPTDMSTRVSILVRESVLGRKSEIVAGRRAPQVWSLAKAIRHLIAGLDIQFEYDGGEDAFIHGADWASAPPLEFLSDLYQRDTVDRWTGAGVAESYNSLLQPLADEHGRIWGRAAIELDVGRDTWTRHSGYISVGGFTAPGETAINFVGLLSGDTTTVSRERAHNTVPKEVLASWLEGQSRLLSKVDLYQPVRVSAGHSLFRAGVRNDELPFCFFENQERSWGEFRSRLKTLDRVVMPIRSTYGDNYELLGISGLRIDYATTAMEKDVIVYVTGDERLFSDEVAKAKHVAGDKVVMTDDLDQGAPLFEIVEVLRNEWGVSEVRMEITTAKVFQATMPGFSPNRLALVIQKEGT